MYRSKTISVAMPCYNEEEGLEKILQSKPQFIDQVVVVDNNSFDNTVNVAKKYGATVVHETRKGYGYAYLAGLLKVTGDIIALLDGDDSYPIAEIERLLLHMENEHCDFVSGRRYPLVNKKVQPRINKFANHIVSWLIRLFFRIPVKDSQSGMMVFKRSLLDKIKIYNTGMGFSQEIKIRAFTRSDLRCGEVHISYRARAGKVKFKKLEDSLKNLYSLFYLWKELIYPKVSPFRKNNRKKE
jgi:glycosyltransferase involved in cell wall biosynthesis